MLIFRVIGRLFGRFFKGIGYIIAAFFRFLRRHEMALGMVVVVALVVGGLSLLLSALNINIVMGQPQTSAATVVVVATPAPVPTLQPAVTRSNAPDATEAFMRGQASFNAGQVWDSLDAALHTSLQSKGLDKAALEKQLLQQKSSGIQYETYQYIGGYKTPEGGSIHFYVLRLRDTDNKPIDRSFTFRLGDDGKIDSFTQT